MKLVDCRSCGDKGAPAYQTSGRLCKKCFNKRIAEGQRIVKQKCVDHLGGKCQHCGYDRYIGALSFHHLDPLEKDPEWSKMSKRSFEAILPELNKCILLCHNCHAEEHDRMRKDSARSSVG